MAEYVVKIVLTSMLVVAISETAKRSSLAGAILASLPLTSLLAFVWLYVDTGDTQKVASLATGIFWLVLPSLRALRGASRAAGARRRLLARACRLDRAHGGVLFRHDLGAGAARHRNLTDACMNASAAA